VGTLFEHLVGTLVGDLVGTLWAAMFLRVSRSFRDLLHTVSGHSGQVSLLFLLSPLWTNRTGDLD